MKRIARVVVEHPLWAGLFAVLIAGTCGLLVSLQIRDIRHNERLQQLQIDAERRGIEIMSQTLDGSLMGAVAVLGLINDEIKQEVVGRQEVNSPRMLRILESIAKAYSADGVFLVSAEGLAVSSWDNSGKPSTGLDLKFRPYYRMAMQGMENVYAAVSIARGDRSLYFTAPVFKETTSWSTASGAVVARSNMQRVDELLQGKNDIALLLSPQGVVFASNRPEWIGFLAVEPTPERIRQIRELKQFGKLFDERVPSSLPLSIKQSIQTFEGKRYALASSRVQWNDPSGDWKLVLFEDLGRTVDPKESIIVGAGGALAVLLLCFLGFKILRSQQQQVQASVLLQQYAHEQETNVRRKTEIADASARMQGAKTVSELATIFFEETHRLFEVLQGVIYVGAKDILQLAGSYACANPPPEIIAMGDGLLGQCAVERQAQLLTVNTGHFVMVRSGLGETAPTAVLFSPILLNENLLGVIEMAFLHHPDAAAQAQLQELLGRLAMNIEIVSRSAYTEAMLSTTQAVEQANAEQLAFQQALIDTIPYPVFYKDRHACFVGVNTAYEKAFAVQREELIGKRLTELNFIEESKRAAAQQEDERLIAEVGSVNLDTQVLLADGQRHDLIRSITAFRGADGQPAGLVGILIDVTEIKNAERELDHMADMQRFNRLAQGREQRVLELKREINAMAAAAGKPAPYNTTLVETIEDHEFATHPDYRTTLSDDGKPLNLYELVDLAELQVLLTNFCESVGIASAIIDLEGKILAAAHWQRACTDFHRVNPESCARCIESDTELAVHLQEGREFTLYKCKNGMTDAAAPIIVEGRHLANVFIGQFHSAAPDIAFFRDQARQFAYPEAEYIEAVEAAPVIDEKRLPSILSFLSGFARLISTMSLARRRADLAQQALQQQADLLQRERVAALSLAEDAEQARIALEGVAKESLA